MNNNNNNNNNKKGQPPPLRTTTTQPAPQLPRPTKRSYDAYLQGSFVHQKTQPPLQPPPPNSISSRTTQRTTPHSSTPPSGEKNNNNAALQEKIRLYKQKQNINMSNNNNNNNNMNRGVESYKETPRVVLPAARFNMNESQAKLLSQLLPQNQVESLLRYSSSPPPKRIPQPTSASSSSRPSSSNPTIRSSNVNKQNYSNNNNNNYYSHNPRITNTYVSSSRMNKLQSGFNNSSNNNQSKSSGVSGSNSGSGSGNNNNRFDIDLIDYRTPPSSKQNSEVGNVNNNNNNSNSNVYNNSNMMMIADEENQEEEEEDPINDVYYPPTTTLLQLGSTSSEIGGEGRYAHSAEYQTTKLPLHCIHPSPIVETKSLALTSLPNLTYTVHLPTYCTHYGNASTLSTAQLETVSYACQKHLSFLSNEEEVTSSSPSSLLPGGGGVRYRAGYLIGDGTGVGKGREISGIICDNFMNGRKKAVWISISSTLIEDATRDLNDLGCGRFIPLITSPSSPSSSSSSSPPPLNDDVISNINRRRTDLMSTHHHHHHHNGGSGDEQISGNNDNEGKADSEDEFIFSSDDDDDDNNNNQQNPFLQLPSPSPPSTSSSVPPSPSLNHHHSDDDDDDDDDNDDGDENEDGDDDDFEELLLGESSLPLHTTRRLRKSTRNNRITSTDNDDNEDRTTMHESCIPPSPPSPPSPSTSHPQSTNHYHDSTTTTTNTNIENEYYIPIFGLPKSPSTPIPQHEGILFTTYSMLIRADRYKQITTWLRTSSPSSSSSSSSSPSTRIASRVRKDRGVASIVNLSSLTIRNRSEDNNDNDNEKKGEENGILISGDQQMMTYREFEGVIIFDEGHKAKNLLPTTTTTTSTSQLNNKRRKSIKQSTKTALQVNQLQAQFPSARIVYVSATAVSEPEQLSYMPRLGLWGHHHSTFRSFQDFITTIEHVGVSAMECVTMEMKSRGSFCHRQLSFEGIKMEVLEHQLTPHEITLYDQCVKLWYRILKAIERGGSKSELYYWSSHQSFFLQLIFGLKVKDCIQEIEHALLQQHSVIVGLFTTGEAYLKELLTSQSSSSSSSSLLHIPSIPLEIIKREINNLYDVNLRSSLMNDLESLLTTNHQSLPLNPLDVIIDHFGIHHVAEMTGRSQRLVRSSDLPRSSSSSITDYYHHSNSSGGEVEGGGEGESGFVRFVLQKRNSKIDNINERNMFMNGDKRIAIISGAASTGLSLHSSQFCKNQQPRVHIILELPWSADQSLQQLGRSHRSNQRSAPHYKLLISQLGGDWRKASSISKRLQRMGALTTADRNASISAATLSSYHIKEELFYESFQDTYEALRSQSPLLAKRCMKLGVFDQKEINIEHFLNRLLALPISSQSFVFNLFLSHYSLKNAKFNWNEVFDIHASITSGPHPHHFSSSSPHDHVTSTSTFTSNNNNSSNNNISSSSCTSSSSSQQSIQYYNIEIDRGIAWQTVYAYYQQAISSSSSSSSSLISNELEMRDEITGFFRRLPSKSSRSDLSPIIFAIKTISASRSSSSFDNYLIISPAFGHHRKQLTSSQILANYSPMSYSDSVMTLWNDTYRLSSQRRVAQKKFYFGYILPFLKLKNKRLIQVVRGNLTSRSGDVIKLVGILE